MKARHCEGHINIFLAETMKTRGLKAAQKLTLQIDHNCISSMALMALRACYCDLQLLLCQSDNNSEAAHGQ